MSTCTQARLGLTANFSFLHGGTSKDTNRFGLASKPIGLTESYRSIYGNHQSIRLLVETLVLSLVANVTALGPIRRIWKVVGNKSEVGKLTHLLPLLYYSNPCSTKVELEVSLVRRGELFTSTAQYCVIKRALVCYTRPARCCSTTFR